MNKFLMIMTISVAIQVVKVQDLPPVFVEEPKDVSVTEGADVLLRCKITAIGCRCKWTRGGKGIEIGKGSKYQYISDNERGNCSLHIQQTSRIDENLWSCHIQTLLGIFTSRTAQISFIVPPEAPIIHFMGKDITSEHPIPVLALSPFYLECISRKGKPASTLEWIPDIPLKKVQSFIQQSTDDPHLQDSIITMNAYNSFNDKEYIIFCIAHHPGYNTALTARVKIIFRAVWPAFILYDPRSITVREGEAVRLDCTIPDRSECQWMRGGHVLNFTNDSIYQQTTDEATAKCSLLISQTRRADENLWSCQISTPNHHEISKPAQISFIVPPDPPIIRFQNHDLLEEQTIVVNQSQPFLLECVSRKGKPASFLMWVDDINATNVQHFSQSNSEDPRLQDSILIWNTRGWSKPGNYTVQCTAQHPAHSRPSIINVKFTVARDSIHRKEQNICQDKVFTRTEENAGSKSDIAPTIDIAPTVAITVPIITFTIVGIVIGIRIKRRRSRTIATEPEVRIASFPTYLDVLPNVSKEELSNRPPLPLPRGSAKPELQDDGSDCDHTYTEIDDLIMPRVVNYHDHHVSPVTESAEHWRYQVTSLETVADESQDIYFPPGNEQTSFL